ncbi:phosphoribosyltransferase [Herbaspirillum sp. alder98]|uniref:phosphoribosyltransferase n=1 Tax=Herbaspirillum sp. alder98 TaxID=2913096 RepID=UPI001CD85BBD|nr:phosphoribosyltransferase [Herbaspirillum sp. alder98]MCA1325634.1 phosphoribosyltransferase [Herbaspirillum sp. alder98]
MLDLTRSQPPAWMQFECTRDVRWHEIEAMVQRHQAEIAARYDLLVAVLRAGAPVASLIGRNTGLPIDYLVCNRRNPQPHFLDGEARAPRGRRILLVDDVCGSGWTFERAAGYCREMGNTVGTFSVYRCLGPGMYQPDFSMEMTADTYLRWPWEYQSETEMPQDRQQMAA